MDWMSERLRELIADGKKALGREIVVAEADSPLDEASEDDRMGHLDDGEGGWEDDEELDVLPEPVHAVVRHLGGKGSWYPRKPGEAEWDVGGPYGMERRPIHTYRVKALTKSGRIWNVG